MVPLDLGPVGVFPWCMPSYSSESDLGLSVLLAREKELNVGHFLRLPVTQYGVSSQDGAGMSGARSGVGSLQYRVSAGMGMSLQEKRLRESTSALSSPHPHHPICPEWSGDIEAP